MPLFILETCLILILLIVLISQVILPLFGFFNGRFFWFFKHDEDIVSKKVCKLNELNLKEEELLLDKKIKERELELAKLQPVELIIESNASKIPNTSENTESSIQKPKTKRKPKDQV